MYALSRDRIYNFRPDNDTGNLVTEPLSSNGRPLRFRYNPAFRRYATIFYKGKFLKNITCIQNECIAHFFSPMTVDMTALNEVNELIANLPGNGSGRAGLKEGADVAVESDHRGRNRATGKKVTPIRHRKYSVRKKGKMTHR
jgi:hypothetical protein